MITALDTNVLVALWDRDDVLNSAALTALDDAFAQGSLVISGGCLRRIDGISKTNRRISERFPERYADRCRLDD